MVDEEELTSDQELLYERLKLIAENDGDAYRAHRPSEAVSRAHRQYCQSMVTQLREDFDAIQLKLSVELNERWKATHK